MGRWLRIKEVRTDPSVRAMRESLPMLLLLCPECCDERSFDQPPCEDGHGPDCPEWVCIDCGYGMWLATYPEVELVASVPAAAATRHAA